MRETVFVLLQATLQLARNNKTDLMGIGFASPHVRTSVLLFIPQVVSYTVEKGAECIPIAYVHFHLFPSFGMTKGRLIH